jgi:hypothetical protein
MLLVLLCFRLSTSKYIPYSNFSCIIVHNIQVAAADATAVATADSAFAVAALTNGLSIIAEVDNADATNVTTAATAVATSDRQTAERRPLSSGSDCSAVWLTSPRRMKTPLW